MTLEDAIDMIKREYSKATGNSYVMNPLGYALYETWKTADRDFHAVAAERETDLTDKCGSCAWAMPIKGSTRGTFGCWVACQHPDKTWRTTTAKRKQRTTLKCRLYQPKGKEE